MVDLDPQHVSRYFERSGTVETWWTPDTGPLAFHYDAELLVLERELGIDPSWRVLDVGTGRGRFGAFFARRGCRVVGVDANQGMLDAAREVARHDGTLDRFELRRGVAEDLSRLDLAPFDVALCMELFDHLPDLRGPLREIHRVLKPGGRFSFTYVPGESLYGMLGNVYRWSRTRKDGSEKLISRTYGFSEIERTLEIAGFRLDAIFGVGLLCVSAQTRLFTSNPVLRLLTAIARMESRVRPYYSAKQLARHGAHVVGIATRLEKPPNL